MNYQLIIIIVVVVVVVVVVVSCHTLFFLVLLLNQRWPPPIGLQVSHYSTFRIMCDVPIIAIFCSESIECFPGIASRFFLKLFVTIPVAPIITGIIVHFRLHIRCISILKLLYFNYFSASFCTTFLSAGIATSISVHVFSFLFLIIISGLFTLYYYYYYYYYWNNIFCSQLGPPHHILQRNPELSTCFCPFFYKFATVPTLRHIQRVQGC
jgi:hypothetical protein